ncbi:MAG TPA: hypothetical protein VHO28_01440, partial [Ignavibacteriales bacterium]|nr:hypothetical protein [Ignavibacteriales bacterium]
MLCTSTSILSQVALPTQLDPSTTNSSQKFNQRAIIGNNSLDIDEHEIIGEYDGNVMVKYSTPLEIP